MNPQLKLWRGIKSTAATQEHRRTHLRRAYGISVADYQRLFEAQEGKCAICGSKNPTYGQHREESLCVDHDHKTGKIRGLLCHKCNRAIGNVSDRPDLLRKLADYLEAARNE